MSKKRGILFKLAWLNPFPFANIRYRQKKLFAAQIPFIFIADAVTSYQF